MIGGLDFLERSVLVILLMRMSIVPAVEIDVIFLFAVVWQRLSGNLAAGNTPSVAESGDKQGVNGRVLLEAVEHWSNPFIDKRNSAHLYSNCGGSSARLLWKVRGSTNRSNQFREFSSGKFSHGAVSIHSRPAGFARAWFARLPTEWPVNQQVTGVGSSKLRIDEQW